jgi:hypothetical protein
MQYKQIKQNSAFHQLIEKFESDESYGQNIECFVDLSNPKQFVLYLNNEKDCDKVLGWFSHMTGIHFVSFDFEMLIPTPEQFNTNHSFIKIKIEPEIDSLGIEKSANPPEEILNKNLSYGDSNIRPTDFIEALSRFNVNYIERINS